MSSEIGHTRRKRLRKTKAQLVEESEKLERQLADRKRAGKPEGVADKSLHAEEQIQFIVDSVPVAISYLDSKEKFRFAKVGCRHQLGLAPTELLG